MSIPNKKGCYGCVHLDHNVLCKSKGYVEFKCKKLGKFLTGKVLYKEVKNVKCIC